MEWITAFEDIRNPAPSALALGAFDGLHRGHMAVLREALDFSGADKGVVTFSASPSGAQALLTEKDRGRRLEALGFDRLYALSFPRVRDIPAEEFFYRFLRERCGAAALFCGEDFRFGRGARGDVALLETLCRENGVCLRVLPPVLDGGEKISSTRIRSAVEQGDILTANRLLGRPFGYTLEVIHGNHLGSKWGTPTINQALPEGFILPPFGVYASLVEVDGVQEYGVTNIGVKPTVGSDRVLSETWMPAYSGDLYGRELRLSLLRFVRPERKFDSLDALREEILHNAAQAKEIAEDRANYVWEEP